MSPKTKFQLLAAIAAIAAVVVTWLPPTTVAQSDSPDLERMFASVVGIVAKVPEDARTAPIIGTTRLGSGIVIDSEGLIVTMVVCAARSR